MLRQVHSHLRCSGASCTDDAFTNSFQTCHSWW